MFNTCFSSQNGHACIQKMSKAVQIFVERRRSVIFPALDFLVPSVHADAHF